MALERIAGHWPALERANLLHSSAVGAQFWWLRGRCALALFAMRRGRGRSELRSQIETAAERLVKLRLEWATAFGHILRAALARDEGDESSVRNLLMNAQNALSRAGAHLFAETVRYARGRAVVRGAPGERLESEALAALGERGVKNPQRMMESVLAGFAD